MDSSGTSGRAGKSAFEGGAPFRDEFDSRLTHSGAGVSQVIDNGKVA